MAKKVIFKMAAAAILNCKKISFGHVNRIRFNSCYSVPNFIKIWPFFIEIWRFNDFRNGGRPPSWILKICCFCHLALVDIPFCFLIQNFAEIGQCGRWVMAKKSDFSRWRPPPYWILKFIKIAQFLSASLYVSKRGAKQVLRHNRLCRDVVGRR